MFIKSNSDCWNYVGSQFIGWDQNTFYENICFLCTQSSDMEGYNFIKDKSRNLNLTLGHPRVGNNQKCLKTQEKQFWMRLTSLTLFGNTIIISMNSKLIEVLLYNTKIKSLPKDYLTRYYSRLVLMKLEREVNSIGKCQQNVLEYWSIEVVLKCFP